MNHNDQNSIKEAFYEIKSRASMSIWSMTFYRDLFVAVIVVGGLGIWYSIVTFFLFPHDHDIPEISAAIFTFFPALIAPTLLEMTHEKQPFMRSFSDILKVVFVLLFLICIVIQYQVVQLLFSIFCAIVTVIAWWCLNGNKPCYQDIIREQSTTDSVDTPLSNKNPDNIKC